ncbi:cytochrome b/b6 domain-containing protein [Acidocella aromatica]|uniref:Cytochrome b561 n=1 Tax=Acidocella aromatica TaxID=1303579 RepID=A0A840VB85_9PROT|nr:cytochrome b/b6 domain-containing protein [Acidocella aromatica]MBB5372097.1 cytochrome b561 [Acidocella aromatica]
MQIILIFIESMPASRPYSRTRIMLHWLSAGVILWASLTGFIVAQLPRGNPVRQVIDILNPQITTLFIPFFLWRLALYLRAAPWWRSGATLQQRAATSAHMALYASISAVLVSGLFMMSAPWHLLGLIPMPQLTHGVAALQTAHDCHHAACMALAWLISAHLAAVALHQLGGQPILRRMRWA